MESTHQPTDRYLQAAREAGCPRDQIENFLRAGIVLQPQQLKASAAARLCDHEGGPTDIGYGGARGGGKSHWGLAQIFVDDCARRADLKFLYIRKVGKTGKEAIHDLRRSVLHGVAHDYTNNTLIRRDNGSRVVLGHFQHEKDIDNYLGLEYDGVLIEEATQLSARKVKDVGTCIRTSKLGWRPRKYFTTNPGNIGHAWFKHKFIEPLRANRETFTRFIQATVYDNKFVNPEYRTELEKLTGWQRRAWLDGDWDIAAGQFFTTFRRQAHSVDKVKILEDWPVWMGLDYGFTHFTTAYLLTKDGDGNTFCAAEHAERGLLVPSHAKAILTMLDLHKVKPARIRRVAAGTDCFAKKHTGGTIADDYKANGLTLAEANMDRINGAAEILRRLKDPERGDTPRLFISEACPMLLECIPMLQHDPHRPEDVLKVDCDDDGLGGDDPYDGFRYALMVDANRRVGNLS